ncbi:MAG TPA: sugar transferase [Stellaceae bacterium]|nr:sugar transferase [Stellaceae bacterium]
MSNLVCKPGPLHFTFAASDRVGLLAALVRALDIVIALVALIFVLPLMGVVALAIFLQDRGPIVFAHRRIGRGGKSFYCYKFRSMAVDAEVRLAELLARDPVARAEWARDHKLRDDPRVTPLGAFLRRSSLDELPQLINVLQGSMSLVGPRPIVDAEIERYGRRFSHYCAVKPGITGLWQVSGRNDVSYRTRVALDCIYARSYSPRLYLWIVIVTIPAVLSRKGSY